jgi:hypothetical protein
MKGCARRLSVYKVLHRLSDVKVTATAAPVSYARAHLFDATAMVGQECVFSVPWPIKAGGV